MERRNDWRAASGRNLGTALALITSYMVVEVVGGFMANSLALLADAAHMVTDAASLGLALLALWLASRPESFRFTFGLKRAEILSALLNALSLWLLAAWIFWEAYRRFQHPPEVQGPLMLGVGFIGLLINVGAAWVLGRLARENLNVEGAFLHVLGDLLGSIGVVAAALLIMSFGWFLADPIFGVIIGLLILLSSTRLVWKTLQILMESTPSGVNLKRLCQRLEEIEGVRGVHDIHVWSLTPSYKVLSAHVITEVTPVNRGHLLHRVKEIASQEFAIAHVTIQAEDSQDWCDERHHIAHEDS